MIKLFTPSFTCTYIHIYVHAHIYTHVTGCVQSVQNWNTAITIVVKNKKFEDKLKLLKLMALFKPNTQLKDKVFFSV